MWTSVCHALPSVYLYVRKRVGVRGWAEGELFRLCPFWKEMVNISHHASDATNSWGSSHQPVSANWETWWVGRQSSHLLPVSLYWPGSVHSEQISVSGLTCDIITGPLFIYKVRSGCSHIYEAGTNTPLPKATRILWFINVNGNVSSLVWSAPAVLTLLDC